jgi:cysteinyl-tRNA synthetase
MATKYLGEQIDIHTGGQEHMPVHHTNEIAQSEAGFGKKPWVKYWIHFAWLLFQGEKISKSSGSTYLLSDLEKEGYNPLALRYLYLTTHYKKPLNFSFDMLDYAQNAYNRLKNIMYELKSKTSWSKKNKNNIELAKKQFLEIINDDLNTSKAVSYLWDILRDNRLNDAEKYELAIDFDRFFGLQLDKQEKINVPLNIKKMVEEREEARKNKEWKKSDEIRDKINKLGYVLEDIGEEIKIKKKTQ